MALICPNKKSKEWRDLLSYYGGNETDAMVAFIANGQEIPSVDMLKAGGKEGKEAPRFQRVVENLQRQVSIVESEMIKAKTKLADAKTSGDDKLRSRLYAKYKQLESSRDNLLQKAVDTKKLDTLTELLPIAHSQLENAENLLTKPELSFEELQRISAVSDIWKRAGEIRGGESFFYTPEEIHAINEGDEVYKEIDSKLGEVRSRAERLYNKWETIAVEYLNSLGSEKFGDEFQIDTSKPIDPTNFAFRNTMPISESDNQLLQLVSRIGKDANTLYMDEAKGIVEEIDRMVKESGIKDFDVFTQEFGDGDTGKTGNLISRFSYKFFEESEVMKARLEAELNTIDESDMPMDKANKAKGEAYKKYMESIRNRQIVLDPRLLFPEGAVDASKVASHITELKSTLGERGYEYYKGVLESRIKEYREQKESVQENINAEFGENTNEAFFEMQLWDAKHNPYLLADRIIDGKGETKIAGQVVRPNYYFTQSVPRRSIGGKDTGYYDSKYSAIENDPKKLELYEYIINTNRKLNRYLGDEISGISPYSLAYIKNTTLKKYMGGGMKNAVGAAYEDFINGYKENTTGEFVPGSTVDTNDVGVIKARAKLISDNRGRIGDYIKLKTIKYENETGSKVTPEMVSGWKREITAEIAGEKSYDIPSVLKMYALSATQYKYMSRVEPAMALANEVFREMSQVQKNSYDTDKVSDFSRKLRESNTSVAQLEDTIKHFMGMGTRKKEGVVSTKSLSAKDTLKMNELDKELELLKERLDAKKITQDKFDKDAKQILKEKNKLGGYVNTGAIGDSFLNYYQLLGMGWNGFAGIINVGVGWINNYIEASGGERFTLKELNEANFLVQNSILKGVSLEFVNTPQAKKIRSLMEKYQVLKELQYDIKDNTNPMKKFLNNGRTKYLPPYTMQAMTEYVNQAPVMIAMLKHAKVTDAEGSEISLWDAYDGEGNIKEGITFNTEDFLRKKAQIDEAIVWNHGNYDPDRKVMYKNSIIGRALFMFRGWLPMAINARWGKEITDMTTGLTKKGRYRSYGTLYKTLGAGKGTIELTKGLLRKLAGLPGISKVTGVNSQEIFDSLINDEFTAHDAANLRRNMQELIIYAGLVALTLLLRAAVEDDDEDKETYYFWINQINRAQSDLSFYINPTEFTKLNSSVVPAFNAINAIGKATNYTVNMMFGGDDTYQSGPHKGESKSLISWTKTIPGATQLPRLSAARDRVFEQNTLTQSIMNEDDSSN